jgi:hypothetical protein
MHAQAGPHAQLRPSAPRAARSSAEVCHPQAQGGPAQGRQVQTVGAFVVLVVFVALVMSVPRVMGVLR